MSATPPSVGRSRLTRGLLRLGRALLVAYLLVLLVMSLLETRLVYRIPPLEKSDWSPPEGGHEEAWMTADDGARLHGWFYDRPGARRALLYCHGNGEQVADIHGRMLALSFRLDAAVLSFDYRGYGKSLGKPTERGLLADGRAAADWLAERTGRTPGGLVLMGRSLGGGVAVALAAERGAEALVLESTFTRLTDAAAGHYPWLPVRLLMRNRFDSIGRLTGYDGPLWLTHGLVDRVVPVGHSERLFAASPSPRKQLALLPGLGHNDPFPAGIYTEMRAFLDSGGAGIEGAGEGATGS